MKPFRSITRVGILALAGLIWMAFPAAAGPVVDPSTLQPPPPPGAECRADGQSIICHTSLVLTPVNEPVAELPAGPCTRPVTMFAVGSAGTTATSSS